MSTIDMIIVLAYMVGMFIIGLIARSEIKDMDDFILGGKRFGTFSLTATLMATLTGAGMTIGIAGSVVNMGASAIWTYIGFAIGLFATVYFAPIIRATNKRSLAEIIAGEFGSTPRVIVALFSAIYVMGSACMCLTGMGRMISYIGEPWGISITTGVIITTIIAVVYTAMGGLYAVVWTDVVQFIIMFIGIILVGPILAIVKSGGIVNLANSLAAKDLSLVNPFVGSPISSIISITLIYFLSVPGDPTVPQRILAAKDVKSTQKALNYTGVAAILYGIGILIIGAASGYLLPNIAAEYGTAEAAFPIFILRFFPPVIRGFTIAALIAAIMSTTDSMILVAATSLVYDIGSVIFPDVNEDKFKKAMPIAVIALGGIGLFVALRISSLLSALYFIFSLVSSAFIFPLLATLYWKRATKWGITSSLLGGGICCIVMFAVGYMGPGGDPVFLSMLVSFVSLVVATYLTGGAQTERVLIKVEPEE
ncbi:MAG: sodium:solute symporter family protein [Firmicutes bacterium]|nr:sodium:solute symporter family protein [Bacillota bacterium]